MQHCEGLGEEKTDILTPPLCLLGDMIEVCLRLLLSHEWETFSLSCLCVLVLALLDAQRKEDKLWHYLGPSATVEEKKSVMQFNIEKNNMVNRLPNAITDKNCTFMKWNLRTGRSLRSGITGIISLWQRMKNLMKN